METLPTELVCVVGDHLSRLADVTALLTAHRRLFSARRPLLEHILRGRHVRCASASCRAPLPCADKNTLFVRLCDGSHRVYVFCESDCLHMANLENDRDLFFNLQQRKLDDGSSDRPIPIQCVYLRG